MGVRCFSGVEQQALGNVSPGDEGKGLLEILGRSLLRRSAAGSHVEGKTGLSRFRGSF